MKHWQRLKGRTSGEFKALQGEPVKIGSPHFMDFGENPEHSPDGKAQLIAHGARARAATNGMATMAESRVMKFTCCESGPASST
jgi:hypothetical protein